MKPVDARDQVRVGNEGVDSDRVESEDALDVELPNGVKGLIVLVETPSLAHDNQGKEEDDQSPQKSEVAKESDVLSDEEWSVDGVGYNDCQGHVEFPSQQGRA